MRFSIILTILIINQGCENIAKIDNNINKDNSTYLCVKCGSSLYSENELFYENDNSKDFNNSIEKKVKHFDNLYELAIHDSIKNKFKTGLFCTKCDTNIGNLINDEKGQRHCIDKNAIILKNLIK
jgi:peptide methionine sulfoxide reductase MsrB